MKILLLDRDWPQTAYLVVQLAQAGIEVVLVSTRLMEPWGLGRYCRQIFAPKGVDDPEFLETLLSQEPADIVLPLCETTQGVLWKLNPDVTANVFPRTNEHQRLLLEDRRELYKFAASLDVPAPKFVPLSKESDIENAIRYLGFPLVLRGTQGLSGDQVRIVTNPVSAVEEYHYLLKCSPDQPFAQEFVTGQRCLIGGLFDQGRMLQWFSQTTIEAIWETGPSLRVRSIRDPKLTTYAERLFRGLEWNGLACAEFMRNEAGEYFFLEINPRPWAAIQAAHYCGVPLLSMFADYLLGSEPAKQIEFPDNKDATLFPQFITSRISARRFGQWRDRQAYGQAFMSAPWRHPPLLLHFMRKIWWALRGG